MEFKIHSNDAEFRSLMSRLKGAGRKANTTMKTSMRRSSKQVIKEMRDEVPVRTGATQRSLGSITTKDGVLIGVRPNYVDSGKAIDKSAMNYDQMGKFTLKHRSAFYQKGTGKKPIVYSARINAISKHHKNWFGRVWDRHKNKISKNIVIELKTQLNKKGF